MTPLYMAINELSAQKKLRDQIQNPEKLMDYPYQRLVPNITTSFTRNDWGGLIDFIRNTDILRILEATGISWIEREARLLKIIRYILSLQPDLEVKCFHDFTALIYAAELNDILLVHELLEQGADPNAVNVEHESALFFAVTNNNPEMIQLLLDKGARKDIMNCRHLTPRDWAIQLQWNDLISLL